LAGLYKRVCEMNYTSCPTCGAATDKNFNRLERQYGELNDLKGKVFQALGAASVCWDKFPEGIFDSTRCKEVGDNLWLEIERLIK